MPSFTWAPTSRWPAAALGAAVSAALFYSSIGLGRSWPAVWVAPVPVLAAAFRVLGRTAFLAAFASYLLGSLNLLGYLRRVAPPPVVFTALVLPAVMFGLAVAASRTAERRLPPWLAVLAFPCAWTTWEFLFSLVSPNGTIFSLAYTQADFLPVLQLASLTGIWGVTFLVCLAPSAMAVAWSRRALSPLVLPAILVSATLAYGAARLTVPPSENTVRAGLAATDQGVDRAFNTEDPALALSVAQAYADRVARLAAEGARVVVLPEKFTGVTPADAGEVEEILAGAARRTRTFLVAGLNRVAIRPRRNVAIVFSPDGRAITEYDKRHMLPGAESGYEIGRRAGLFVVDGVPWGVAICKDMDFPPWLREYGRRGVRILAVPAWDFVADGRLHARMAVVRGVENGFALVRTAQQGLLTVSDAYGRILGEAASPRTGSAFLVRDVPPGPGATLYSAYGDWFGWGSALALVVLLVVQRISFSS